MPSRCSVPLCKGNYPTGPKVSIFSYPNEEDLKQKWLRVIQRDNFYPKKSSRVCELHFKDDDFKTESNAYDEKTGRLISVPIKIRRLKDGAIPSVFINYPKSNIAVVNPSRENPEDKRIQREMLQVEQAINSSLKTLQMYKESREVKCLNDVLKYFNDGVSNFWTVSNDNNTVYLFHIEYDPQPFIKTGIKIDECLNLSMYYEKKNVTKLSNISFPCKIQNLSDIDNILQLIEANNSNNNSSDINYSIDLISSLLEGITSEDKENNIKFMQEQLKLLQCKSNNFRYSADMLIFSSILKSISPHAYKFIRNSSYFILPHPDTLQKVCNNLHISPESETFDDNFLFYISNRVNHINDYEKTVVLLLDEIHIKPVFDYKGGTIVGAAFDSEKAATSAFVFMISSLLSPFKEVVHIMPVCKIDSYTLHEMIKKVIVGLENIGLKVTSVITDNNAINVKSLSLLLKTPQRSFVYPHPMDENRPLFFLIDSVHIFKNIRNNWLNVKNPGLCFHYPDFDDHSKTCIASFDALKSIHEIETNKIVKYAVGLTLKSLFPSNLERQNVRLVQKVFNKFVIQALLELGPKHQIKEFEGTANFISIICKWWDIFNVKTTTKGIHQRNNFMSPLTNDKLEEKNVFLNKFLVWLDEWEKLRSKKTGSLSRETHTALVQTTHGLMEFTDYCIDECQMKYVLPGKVQTDSLEARFGKYRQLAGSQYHISMRQLLECEKKLRLQSCVKLELLLESKVVSLTDFDSSLTFTDADYTDDNLKMYPPIMISDSFISSVKPYLPVLTYLGGYCCYSALKKLKCEECKYNLTLDKLVNLDENYKLIKNLDRGGLKCPNQFVVNLVMYNYAIVNQLYGKNQKMNNQPNIKKYVINVSYNTLKESEINFEEACSNGHEGNYIMKLLLCVSTNIMLKNLCAEKNDNLKKDWVSKKRKLETLQKK